MTNPYPDFDGIKIDGFEYIEPLFAGRHQSKVRPGAIWEVSEDYRVAYRINGARVTLLVPKGTPTDFSSVPAALRPIVSRVGAHLEASIVHDYLYDAWAGFRTEPLERDRLFADKVFRAGLLAARLPTWRRALMYQAVRRFGWRRFVAPIHAGQSG